VSVARELLLDRAERLARLRSALEIEALDALLLTRPASVRYLSGYGGSNGVAVVLRDGGPEAERLLTDFRYETAAEPLRESWDVRIVDQDLLSAIASRFERHLGTGLRVGFEAAVLPYAAWKRLDEAARAAGSELVASEGLVERLRAVKSAAELEPIRRGAAITDAVYAALADEGLVGASERDLAFHVDTLLREHGADGPAFPTLALAAEGGALPHGVPRDAEIERGTLVVLDFGARVDGYCSDCTRTMATGTTDDAMKEAYEVVLRAQAAALELVRPGTACIDVHEAARLAIVEAGYGPFFNHGTGHGVGLEIHEEPRFRAGQGGVLEPGNVVTVEPGVYLPGRFGVRIEDLVVVTPDGHEVLTHFPTSLLDAG
jgi:Xaa-Pro aminopeptidase